VTTEIHDSIKDVITALNWFAARERQRGVHFPDHVSDALKRLADSLWTADQLAARRLEDLRSQRGRLISKRSELEMLRRQQQWLLKNPQGQPADLLARTKKNAPLTVAEHDSCIRRLDAIEVEIAAFNKTANAA
jgi:hypothetical protein